MSIYSFYNSYRFNIDSDPTKAAPHNINYGTAFNFNLSKYNLFAFAKYNYFLWEDALSNIGTSEKLNDMSVGVSYIDKNFLISSMAEFYLYDKSGDMPSYQYKMCDLTLGYNFNTGQKLQASLDYYMYDKSIIFKNFDNRLQARFSADVPVTSSTKFKFLFTTSNLLKNNKLYNYNNSYADASLEQYLMWNHLLILSARYYDYGNSYLKNNYAVMAEYRIPIKIPTWKKERPMISITGRLYDAENPETGMSGVTLYADGKSAVTDNKGFYEFENMKPDVYYLELNRLTLAPGKTTVQKTPIEISIKAGEEARVDIGIIRSASILGKVMLYDFEEKNKLDTTLQNIKESFGLPDFQIYMHNGRPDLYTAASDSRGKFEFRDLPPGHWVVKIIEGNYPDYHYLETDSASFNLVAGEKKELTFRILPRVRPIKIAVRTDTIKTEEELKPPVEITPKIPLSIGVAHRFNYDGWTDSLDAMTRSYLNDVAQYIKDNKNFVVSIEGHTDNIGGIAVTQQLSIQKAQLMRNYLIKKGVPSGNILTQGLGSRRPIAPNTTPQGRSRNRRVEITIKRK
jgi:outer membrane protein OmpA-like peptidoglycan-associated protein